MLRFGRSSGMLRSLAVCSRRISNKPSVNSASPMAAQTLPPAASPLLPLPISDAEVTTLEDRLVYSFRHRKVLEGALIHTSYPNRGRWRSSTTGYSLPAPSYKALMEIGKGSLFDTLRIQHDRFALRQLFAHNYSAHKIARAALRLGLYDFLRRRAPKLDQRVEQFVREEEGEVLYSGNPLKVPRVLHDIVHAMMGAILVDCGDDHAKAWDVMRLHLYPIFSWRDIKHSVATLRDICKDHQLSLEFKNNNKIGATRVFINNRLHGSAGWCVKSDSEGLAALYALTGLPKYMLPQKMLTADGSLPQFELDDSIPNIPIEIALLSWTQVELDDSQAYIQTCKI